MIQLTCFCILLPGNTQAENHRAKNTSYFISSKQLSFIGCTIIFCTTVKATGLPIVITPFVVRRILISDTLKRVFLKCVLESTKHNACEQRSSGFSAFVLSRGGPEVSQMG